MLCVYSFVMVVLVFLCFCACKEVSFKAYACVHLVNICVMDLLEVI